MIRKSLLHFTLFLFAAITLIPMWVMMVGSLQEKASNIGLKEIWPDFSRLTLQNYISVWTEGNFAQYFINSLIVTIAITLANVLFDSMAAYALARRNFRGRGVLMGVILGKLMIPAAVLIVPTFIVVREIHLYDTHLALILPLIAETFGIFLLRQYMLSLPISLEEAARLEGASDWRIFFTIIMPLCKPALAVVIIHSVMTSWNAYIYPLILTSSDSMRTLPLGIAFYRASHSGVDSGHLLAASMIASLPIIVVFLIFQKKIISGLTKGAVKG